ncbi:uncharacterized protein [Anolis sagrei]|uniref:uncharacterized protein n=1 Tax=Anolis sagrei TaxID=38937 RepID=UPI0035211F6A
MAPKKNVGITKGKGLAKKAPTKHPFPSNMASLDKVNITMEDLKILLDRVAALERRNGKMTPSSRPVRLASKRLLIKSLLSRISALEAESRRRKRDVSSGQPTVKLEGPTKTLETAPQVHILEPSLSSRPASSTQVARPASNTQVVRPAGNTQVVRPVNNTQVVRPASNTQVARPASNTNTNSQASAAQKSTTSVLQPQNCWPQQPNQQDLGTITSVQTLPDRHGPYHQYWGTPEYPLKDTHESSTIELGGHLAQKTIDKILRGEYIDLFSLLFREPDESDDEENMKKREIDQIFPNWLNGFMIYAVVITKAYPTRGCSLFKYLNIIHNTYVDYSGNAWLLYDKRFRMAAARNPTLRWDLIEGYLWMQVITPPRWTRYEKSDSGHTILTSEQEQSLYQVSSQQQKQRAVCWVYSSQGECFRRVCRFQHCCSICNGTHSSKFCNRENP